MMILMEVITVRDTFLFGAEGFSIGAADGDLDDIPLDCVYPCAPTERFSQPEQPKTKPPRQLTLTECDNEESPC